MLKLSTRIPDAGKIKNIIFDFGGVICDLVISRSVEKFKEFGPSRNPSSKSKEEQDREFEQLVAVYECGTISSDQFRKMIQDHYAVPPSIKAIDEAWNILLGGIPEARMHIIEEAHQIFRTFLLSNSNEIHYHHFRKDLERVYGHQDFDELFEKVYFSYRVKKRKPDPAIFTLVLEENNLVPYETLFIDDTLMHIDAARNLGIQTYHLSPGDDLATLFRIY
jgi:glucose-1-phosphatase